MRLNFDEYGAPDGELLIVAHGLFGAARNWRALAKRLGPGRRVLAVDMRNHGKSPRDPVCDYPAMAGDLAELIEAEGGRAAVLGHSMGGKAAMALAVTRPELVERAIIADIAPVAYDHSLLHHVEAMRAVDLSAASRRGEVEAALAPAVEEQAVRSFLAGNADLTADPPRWDLNLDALAENMDAITGFPRLDGRYEGPALFLYGGASDYLRPSHRPEVLRLFPNATAEGIAGAGHWLHAEKPREFLEAANRFLV